MKALLGVGSLEYNYEFSEGDTNQFELKVNPSTELTMSKSAF